MRIYKVGNEDFAKLEIYDGGALFIGAYILQLVLQVAYVFVLKTTGVADDFSTTLTGLCIIATINELAMLSMPLLYSKIRGINISEQSGIKNSFSFAQGAIIVGIAIFTVIAFSPIANYFVDFIIKTGYDTAGLANLQITNETSLIVALLFMCLLPAVCEEFLYRGHISRAFGDKGYIFSILMTSLFFAIMHGSPLQLVHQFFLGVALCVIYFMTRSLWAAVLAHFVNNAIAIIGNYAFNKMGVEDIVLPFWGNLAMIIGGLGAVYLLFLILQVLSQKKRKSMDYEALVHDKKTDNYFGYFFESKIHTKAISQERILIKEQILQCENIETKEVLMAEKTKEKSKITRRNKLAIIYSLILGLSIWIMNTIMGYIS